MHLNRKLITVTAFLLVAAPALASDEPADVLDDTATGDAVQTEEATNAPAQPISMDRGDWPAIVITPADGQVTHHPAFMGDVPMGEDIVSPLHAPDPVWQLQESLRGNDAGNLNGENLADLAAQPVIALARFAVMPFRMVLENPWSQDTSPK